MLQNLILIDALFSACWKRKKGKQKEEKGKTTRGLFPPGQTHPISCAMLGLSSC
jgi:hypothetical protein